MGDPSWGWSGDGDGYQSRQYGWNQGETYNSNYAHQGQNKNTMHTASPDYDYYQQQAAKFSPPAPFTDFHRQPYNSSPQDPYGFSGIGDFSQQLVSDPMLSAAKHLGSEFAVKQKEKFSKYLSALQLKFYFAVDNKYVGKKLGIILFPLFHRDWDIKYSSAETPVPPRLDVNAPDLYIPLMAFFTYILISSFVLGTQGRFSPEQLGMITTNALAYLIFENIIILVTRYIMNISKSLTLWHSIAYSGYKFVGMDICLIAFAVGGRAVYYWLLVYTSCSTVIFLLRTVKTFVLDIQSAYNEDGGRKRKIYLLLFISLTQPFLMWWLTSSVTKYSPSKLNFAQLALSGMGLSKAVSEGQVPLLPNGEVDYEALLKMP